MGSGSTLEALLGDALYVQIDVYFTARTDLHATWHRPSWFQKEEVITESVGSGIRKYLAYFYPQTPFSAAYDGYLTWELIGNIPLFFKYDSSEKVTQ